MAPRVNVGGWRLWIGLAFSLIFIVLVLRDVDLAEVVAALQQADVGLVALAVASFLATGAAKAARWRLLFALRKTPSFGRAFAILWIGLAINAFGPARLGDLARAYLIGEAESESKIYALGTIAVEKLAELFFLMLTLALLLSQMSFPDWLEGPARATAWLIGVTLPLFLGLAWQSERIAQGLAWVEQRFAVAWGAWLVNKARVGLQSLELLRHPRLLANLLVWSLLIWILGASTNYFVFGAMGLALPLWAALLLLLVLQVGVAVPSSPGRVGVFQFLVVITLTIFGVDKQVALGYSVILYLVVYVPIAMIGIYCLWYEKVTWQKLRDAVTFLGRWGQKVK